MVAAAKSKQTMWLLEKRVSHELVNRRNAAWGWRALGGNKVLSHKGFAFHAVQQAVAGFSRGLKNCWFWLWFLYQHYKRSQDYASFPLKFLLPTLFILMCLFKPCMWLTPQCFLWLLLFGINDLVILCKKSDLAEYRPYESRALKTLCGPRAELRC